jgi:translocation and assembly module TamB
MIAAIALAALAGACAWLVGTTGGLRFLAARALPHLPVTVAPDDIGGRLVGPLSLDHLELAAPGVGGSIERIELDWRPMALLRGNLHILELQVVHPQLSLAAGEAAPASAPGEDAAPFALPLGVVVDRLVLVNGTLQSGAETLVDGLHVELAGRAAGRALELDHLDLRSNRGKLAGHARAGAAPDAPWDIDLVWQVTVNEHEYAGHTRITGRFAQLVVAQEFSAPLVAQLAGTLEGLPEAPAWNLEASNEPLAAQAGPWPEFMAGLAARLQVTGTLADSTLTGSFELPALAPGSMVLEARGGWADQAAILQRLAVTLPDDARLSATGRFVPGEAQAGEFTLDGERLRWPLDAADPVLAFPRLAVRGEGAGDLWRITADASATRTGLPDADLAAVLQWAGTTLTVERLDIDSPGGEIRARIEGLLETADGRLDYRVTSDARIELPDYPPVSMLLAAAGDASGVRIEELDARLLGGTLRGEGRIAWGGEQLADFSLTFANLDPASLAPDWPGQLAGTLELRGVPTSAEGLEISLRALRGQLNSLPVQGEAGLNLSESGQVLHHLSLSVGTASLQASGRLDEASVTLEATLDAPALDDMHDHAAGSLSASARVGGARQRPRIELEAHGTRLRWQSSRVRELRVDMDVDLSGGNASRIRAELEGFAAAPGPGASLLLEADGTPDAHDARLEFRRRRQDQRVQLALRGGIDDSHWLGQLTELTLAEAEQEIWALQSPAKLSAGNDGASLAGACMDGTLGRLCLDAGWVRGGPWDGHAELSQLDLEPLSEWLGGGLLARGVLSGRVDVEADEDAFRGLTGGLTLTAGDIRVAGEDSGALLAWQGGTLELTGDVDQARASIELTLAGEDRLEGRLVAGWNAADPPLEGRLEARLAQLDIISELMPELAELRGRATAEALVSGTVGEPVLTGRFEWLDGRAEIPTLGLAPRDIHVLAALVEGVLSFTATGRSGDGEFEADGRFDLAAEGVEGRATLKGDGLLLANLPEARVTASPDLRLHYTGRNINVGGEVSIPFARITGLGGPGAVTASPDEVIVGPRARAEDEGISVASRVRVSVGPDVQVQAAGLRGRVEGSILTVTQPQALPWGRGELRVVDGTFGVFGQRLEIQTGRLIYSGGPLENPGLDIRAVRRVDTVTAGALVRGTLRQPEISIYSDPAMSNAEALSYLTLGKGLDELQAGEQRTVNQAASSLALSGGGLIAQDLGRRLGFDDVAVTADDETGGASVVISKYLGGGLYVSYGLGLFDTVNTLRLRYQLNQRLSVEATSGEESAADFYYTFERD